MASVDLLDGHQVPHGVDQAAHLGAVLTNYRLADLAQTERAQRLALVALAADGTPGLGHLELRHVTPPVRHGHAASQRAPRPPAAGHGGPRPPPAAANPSGPPRSRARC